MSAEIIGLDGTWEVGTDRLYDRHVTVPGLASDPGEMDEGRLWYRRSVPLPAGGWTHATLQLLGARFCPSVYVNGDLVSETPGGMTWTRHQMCHPAVRPGATVSLEIALKSLRDVDEGDASRIPEADWWRSNVSSCLWDSVRLRLHGAACIYRVIPHNDLQRDRVTVSWEIQDLVEARAPRSLDIEIIDEDGAILADAHVANPSLAGQMDLALGGRCRPWSPEHPNCYRLQLTLRDEGGVLDRESMTWGLREFGVRGKAFSLNGRPVTLRGGTAVWHRWTRDPEARQLAFDVGWFERNIVQRLKDHGANTLRFHLGMPPEAFLDLCDRHGLMAQVEWSFFHGLKGSKESLIAQWGHWLDLCMRHPCACLIHPWNETDESQLDAAWAALDALAPRYPPLVISHRDVLHVHKYWWSAFENLGLYYDSAEQFDKPIMVDEFGGNYLDGQGEPGSYPTIRESLLRFLGRGHTRELRLQLQTESNARVAEYWRRLGAAGFSPFCMLGSPQDGNHHFLGALVDGRPKPVWDALTAAYAPQSCSLETWDRNYGPGQRATMPVYLFNETDEDRRLTVEVRVVGDADPDHALSHETIARQVAAHGRAMANATISLPDREGDWRLQAVLLDEQPGVRRPVMSEWRVRTLHTHVPQALARVPVGVPRSEPEIRALLESHGIVMVDWDDPQARVLVTGLATWERMADAPFRPLLESAITRGTSVVMLDVGPRFLGTSYPRPESAPPLKGAWQVVRLDEVNELEMDLFHGVRVRFCNVAESESCLHPSREDASLWDALPLQATWLWNGLRGGLVAPAVDMEPSGLSQEAFLALWESRGASRQHVMGTDYHAYELAGFYAFSQQPDDSVIRSLQERVAFLVEDAPALEHAINPRAPVRIHDLAGTYRASRTGRAVRLTPLASCGKNLSQSPVVRIEFGPGRGVLVLSQLLTAGRLAEGYSEPGLYGIRHDPAACQLVLNMLANALEPGRGGVR